MAILSTEHEIRIDLGNYCNLDCPSCFRQSITESYNKEHDTKLEYHPYLNKRYVTLEDVVNWFPPSFLKQRVNRIKFNGATAEPTLNPEIFEIIEYFSNYVETITMSSNGSTRNVEWWSKLGKTKMVPTITIDSFKENNNLYRVNSNSKKIEDNLRAFVSAGGKAILKLILFKHNQDEIDQFISLSEELNCGFRLVPAYEFDGTKTSYEVTTKKGKTYVLEQNTLQGRKKPFREELENPKDYCYLTTTKQFIIHANGVVYPCCTLEGQFFCVYEQFFIDGVTTQPKTDLYPELYEDIIRKVEIQGGIKTLSLRHNKIEDILNSSFFRSALELSWKTKTNKTCMNCKNWPTDAMTLKR